jgi:hypothetical protein
MRYEVYRHKDASDAQFNLISDMYKRIMSEDKYLCALSQKNLNTGVFVNGELHPEMERGPLHFQKTVREVVMEHHKKEEDAGHEIWPAEERITRKTAVDQDTIAFRTGMDTYSTRKEDLAEGLTSNFALAIAV